MNPETVEKFKQYFVSIEPGKLPLLDEIYADDVVFKDPIHEIVGRKALKSTFQNMNANVVQGSFTFTNEIVQDDQACLTWDMDLTLKRPSKSVHVSGTSVLEIGDKVISQRDYFDAGELFYENVPLLGAVIRFLKRKLAAG